MFLFFDHRVPFSNQKKTIKVRNLTIQYIYIIMDKIPTLHHCPSQNIQTWCSWNDNTSLENMLLYNISTSQYVDLAHNFKVKVFLLNYHSYTISITYFKNKYSTLRNINRVKVSLTYRNHHYTMTLRWSWKVARLGSRSSSRPLFCVPLCNWGKKKNFYTESIYKARIYF